MITKTRQGMSLIEVIMYIALFSLLLSTFISYAYAIGMQNMTLITNIDHAYE